MPSACMDSQLFGVFATHSPESCPLNNKQSRDTMIKIDDKIKTITEKFHVKRIIGFYMSVMDKFSVGIRVFLEKNLAQ